MENSVKYNIHHRLLVAQQVHLLSMKMKSACLAFILLFAIPAVSQNIARPKLVVGIVVDQMRWDYLYRFQERYGKGGFKRLLKEGFSCENTFIPYTPTQTAAGHASIYTGSVPALHGIMGNNWYDRQLKRVVYCTEDAGAQTVGGNSAAGRMSPRNMWSTTIADELHLATNFRSKTIAIALKDRGSILPGGHTAEGAYWFDNANANWISSSFYMEQLPQWVNDFNNRKLPDAYLKEGWHTLFPLATYTQSRADSNMYEGKFPGGGSSFPHRTDHIVKNRYESFRYMPAANTYTLEMAKAAIPAEQLGQRGVTDFLAISFSAPDYIGHTFGPNSIEVEDTYLRLDRDLENLLQFLDNRIGKEQYLVFLTSDHGVAHNSTFIRNQKIPGGSYSHTALRKQIADSLQKIFGVSNIIAHYMNYQFYLDDSVINRAGLDKKAIKHFIADMLLKQPDVSRVVDLSDISNTTLPPQLEMMLQHSYHPKLSGDLQLIIRPQWSEGNRTGSTHGQWNPYDAHIPLVWFGWQIKKGKTNREVYMTDIAPTLAALLRIQMPNAAIGKVIEEVVK